MPEIHAQLQLLAAGVGFALWFPMLSFILNRHWCHGRISADVKGVSLLATLTFCVAILFEASINPLYEYLFGHKLWVYRAFPLHDGNVSALSILVWTSYGVHLFFFNQTLDRWFGAGPKKNFYKAAIIAIEAPMIWEVMGNIFFLIIAGEFYAYYVPGELFHLTSIQAIPIYFCCTYVGLLSYGRILQVPWHWGLPFALLSGALVFLLLG